MIPSHCREKMVRVAVVSGATSALGEAVCRRLLSEGYLVARLSRGSETFPCDIRSQTECDTQIQNVVGQYGPVYTLVNCAGVNCDKLLLRSSPSDYLSLFETNVIGAMNLSRSCIKVGGMIGAKEGCLVHVGSTVGVYGNAGQSAYAASKAALIGASNSIAKEYAQFSIRSNVLCPGLISGTKMFDALTEQQKARILSESLLKRCATVEEVADAAFFLASNTYVNAQTLIIDGGR